LTIGRDRRRRHKQFLWIFRLLGYNVWKSVGYSPIDPACYRGEAAHEKARNKIADKLLETLDLAKSLEFAANDFKRLRPGSRNLLLRLAQHALRFRRIRLEMQHNQRNSIRTPRSLALSLDRGRVVLRYGRR
jgi:hypothetical protein